MPIRLVTTVLFLSTAATSVWAAPISADEKAAFQQQCMGDFTTFCGDLTPEDGPGTQACFEKNMAKLSTGCREAIQSFKQAKRG
ncbi:hypothetical protein [Methylobacterium oryzae]|jgi:hypothetical protein|uniref:hypothetical protein n=1 Tax=Methylobacterium oryzae TaxID=334852 RepID=UPI0005C1B3F2|nr:hypothetical protein [Methylobacterium oryzae]